MSQHDPIWKQILRPIIGISVMIPLFVGLALYGVWMWHRPGLATAESMYVALLIILPFWIAWIFFIVRIRLRLEPPERPIEGLQIPTCPHCGYDLRATPDRCPECGNSPSEKN